jgi:3-phenylpropionate/trans-cinnamate dioxygenase ferredoxin reductase subunit
MTATAARIVIVGAGQAGATLAETLRSLGHRGPLTMVGAEPAPPYQRPPLSKKYLLGEVGADRLALKPESFWAEHEVELVLGARATALDRGRKALRLQDGRELRYDMLALTTGARPRRPPAAIGGGLPGVHVLRTLADADALAPEVAPGRRMLVVGGGYIGLEAAAVAAARGMTVTLVEAGQRILGRVAPAETAAYFRDLHARHGVTVLEGATLAGFEDRDGRLGGASLATGRRLPADVAVVGIGVEPETALAGAAGLTVQDGVAVDAACRASDPSVFAAGDCASFPWRGRRVRLESVQNAIDMARAAARSMMGEAVAYDPVPWFWSDQYDVKLQIAGLGGGQDRVVVRPGPREGAQSVWSFAGARLLAVDAMNDARAYMTAKRWLEEGKSPDPTRLADPAAPLAELA